MKANMNTFDIVSKLAVSAIVLTILASGFALYNKSLEADQVYQTRLAQIEIIRTEKGLMIAKAN